MEMFEIRVYDHDNRLLKRSLIQAVCRDKAYPEAYNVFNATDGSSYFILE